eukprot:TRINITY_DN29907_c0_g1_i1.p1 TRINITY_DN29907_c0_g1~~TRINITY_DN29907_c0_g1_i1.p1  ORF type:complete len:193 (-),score=38.46 TRINITY_DN29907_c0_g1_i1:17-538(-)
MDEGQAPRLCDGYVIRELCRDDYCKGLAALLSQLTSVGDLTESRFQEVFDFRARQARTYRSLVVEHCESKQLAATATLIVEAKFVHGGSSVGHVEDVVVDSNHQRRGLARCLLARLAEEAERLGCYKVILDCKDENMALYEKCGYRPMERQMRLDIPAHKDDSSSTPKRLKTS